jgi:hypothetical protein
VPTITNEPDEIQRGPGVPESLPAGAADAKGCDTAEVVRWFDGTQKRNPLVAVPQQCEAHFMPIFCHQQVQGAHEADDTVWRRLLVAFTF